MQLRKNAIIASIFTAFAATGAAQTASSAARVELVGRLESEAALRAAEVRDFSARTGVPVRTQVDGGGLAGLVRVEPGRPPRFVAEENINAAISTNANQVRGNPTFLSVDGTGVIVGKWDGGMARTTHQEFNFPAGPSRITVIDGTTTVSSHATHVAGTMAGAGANAAALGMAPGSTVWSADFFDDTPEMAPAAADAPGQTNRIYHSNHSYGLIAGWISGDFGAGGGVYWFGNWGDVEDSGFGLYDGSARDVDDIVFNSPYYLPIKSSGNDRDDAPPSNGSSFFRWDPVAEDWVAEVYDSSIHPGQDGNGGAGYDSVSYNGVAKNILTVGAVTDAVSGGVRSVSSSFQSGFSSWGPADDGRLKPELVGNGVSLFSSLAGSDTSYGNASGTSMSAPNISGTASLLIQYYRLRFPGGDMRASTLKGLLIHTADDMGPAGPDYQNGFGLVNGLAAAQQIQAHADHPTRLHLREDSLTDTTDPLDEFAFTWDGTSPLVATLCWTDPPGTALDPLAGVDQGLRQLANDLDLSIIGPDATVHRQFRLDGANPAAAATTGDNDADNIRQVRIAAPAGGTTGWTLRIESDGAILDGPQVYSLFLSGQSDAAGVEGWRVY
ncbi:MAG: S8 family serine peptidase [Candidatus Sumerlaeia bacterium]|nr:S8 family serine peptidase [Candidatus Sumerlaeia bacterium]